MRKKQQDNSLFGQDLSKNRNLDENLDKVKTTNINILLNRVRLDKKKALKKRFILILLLITAISFLIGYFII